MILQTNSFKIISINIFIIFFDNSEKVSSWQLLLKLGNISLLRIEKKYSISLLSKLIPILDIDIFSFRSLILSTYSDEEYTNPWSECKINWVGNLVFSIFLITRFVSLFSDNSYVTNFVLWSIISDKYI
ncbi:hypothetical protein [Mycoplasmopsis felis]|nr:hypothetical protein [Mycoplasmopsis felis]WQQ08578.1 hypothetical protein RRG61_00460 [Mycoplasmopsis felis]